VSFKWSLCFLFFFGRPILGIFFSIPSPFHSLFFSLLFVLIFIPNYNDTISLIILVSIYLVFFVFHIERHILGLFFLFIFPIYNDPFQVLFFIH
jgi:hypothetical protein